MDSRLALVVLGAIATAFGRSETIKCYSCDSVGKGQCSDPFKPGGVPTCVGETCTKVWTSSPGVTTVIRGCSSAPVERDECLDDTAVDKKVKSCVCMTDYCNNGQLIKPTPFNVVIGVAIASVTSIARMNKI